MKLSDGEKLIALMLCDIANKLGVRGGEFDYGFIQTSILHNHAWGLGWQYSGIPFEDRSAPPEVKETADILDMYWLIEEAAADLSAADRQRLATEAEPFGTDVRFRGFDGNNEDHFGIASYLVNDMKRFAHFQGRDLNSHSPSIDGYRRMYRVFEPIRRTLADRRLNVDELIAILGARAFPGKPGSQSAPPL